MHQRHIHLQIDPMSVPPIADRVKIIDGLALQYVRHSYVHETVTDFVNQAAADMRDASVKRELRAEIRRLERLGRGGY